MKTIKIITKIRKTKDGKEFTAYQAITKNGDLVDCKFTKDVGAIPDDLYSVEVSAGNFNMSYKKQYPCLWIKAVDKFNLREQETATEYDDLFD